MSEPAKRQSIPIKRRDVLILSAVWVAGCGIVAILLGLFYANSGTPPPRQPEPAATVAIQFSDDTAKIAYLQAAQEAQNWSDDVNFVALSTHWSNATVDNLGQSGGWDFRFFSPRRKRILFVVINNEKQALSRAHFNKLRKSPYLVNMVQWVVDSDQAISIWVNHGGGPFLEAYPENQVEVLLRQSETGPVWDVIAVSSDQSQLFYLTINATNGDILN